MTKQRLKSPRLRLFVALDLPDEVKAGIATWGARELTDPALRPVAPENLHVTLAFLGSRPERDAERIAPLLARAAGPAPVIDLGDPEPRPRANRPRLFALPATSPGAETMQARLVELLVADGLYDAEKRSFWPHVTVARVRAQSGRSRRPRTVERPPQKLPPGLSEAFHGVRMTLYRSELQPLGARYVPLAQVELPGAGRQ
ncbi:MAG TPA: RNA 2',3'-cyclic phosphodiesterase [Solirubrobacterales bacterium]|nr:RNA 2',3'-cyclic phosphodiesterase [Solirubrobacterales bacterium]